MHKQKVYSHHKSIFFLLLILLPALSFAQKKVTLSGYVRDSASSESLIGATVFLKEVSLGAQTNAYGFYSLTVPPGQYTAIYSYVGYGSKTINISMVESKVLNAELVNNAVMREVTITSTRKDDNVKTTDMGKMSLTIDKVKELPVIFGEVDILKTLQLLPGVQSGEGSAGLYIRGGGPDQNLVLLDDATVYNTGHLFGFFSVFNSDAIKDVTLIKGGAPANYGSRLSSVVDVSMKDGNMKEFHGQGGIGLIASRLTLEGPIKKEKGSFMISGRRTYIDVLVQPFLSGRQAGVGYYFYDANLKANYKFSEKDRLYLSTYFGLDQFKYTSANGNFHADIPWGNTTATLRWNHLFSNQLFLNTTLLYNDYNFASSFDQNTFGVKLTSGIRDYNIKSDLDYYTNFNHHFKTGIIYTHHTFIPNQVSGRIDTIVLNPNNALIKYAHEAAAYITDDFDVSSRLRITAGIRYSWFGQIGPYTLYQYDINQTKIDSAFYNSGQLVKDYGGWEPRISARFSLSDVSSIKANIARTYQYIHMVSNNGSTLPTDVWVPSTYTVQPQVAWQYSLGYFHNFLDNSLETSVELYYKDMQHQIEYEQGYTPNTIKDPELSYVFGKAYAYGAEFFINKTQGKFTGWIGYTLAWTYRQFKDLNNGEEFPSKFDRRNDLSVVASFKLNKKWTFSSVFIYASGNTITLPTAFYLIDGKIVQQFSKLNDYRLPAYNRLDIAAIYTPQAKRKRRWEGRWIFSVYNTYNRFNPYFIYVDTQGSVSGSSSVTQKIMEVTLFPILPSVTYDFKF